MVIKSSFKDYYDFVAHKYGGGDPKVVYARERLAPPADDFRIVEIKDNKLHNLDNYRYWSNYRDIDEKYIIVAGKAYLLARPRLSFSEDINAYKLQPLELPPEELKLPSWRRRTYSVDFGKEYPFLIELCRKVGSPAFVISKVEYVKYGLSRIRIFGQCPILGKLGFPKLIAPEQMYQDISYFVGNLMHSPPDPNPPVKLSNNERIKKAGFDLVQSFRHRK